MRLADVAELAERTTYPPKPGPDDEKEFCKIGPSGYVAQACPALLAPRSRQQHSCSWMGPPPAPSMLALARKANLKFFHPRASSWGGKDLPPRVAVVRFASFPGASSGIATCCRLSHRGAHTGTAVLRFRSPATRVPVPGNGQSQLQSKPKRHSSG